MTNLESVVDELAAEAEVDIVGVAWVIGAIRDHISDLSSDEVRRVGIEVARRLVARGVEFGTFSGPDFVPWPSSTAVDQLNAEWQALGREPTLGDIGWFKSPRLDYRPSQG